MLSTRGAITTNVALVECAAGQNKADKNVFLLSELEKVWVSVAVVARRLLLDGAAVQIAPFGALWTEEFVLLRDRQQRPYTTRKLCFGINQTYANRYGIDVSKVPLEKHSGTGYVRVSMADIVAVCGVPARTAAAALKEFFLFLGEGLSRGRIFHLSLPGVATIAMKQQKVVLTMNEELRHALYDIDSRKWAFELKAEGSKLLEDLAAVPDSGVVSMQSSRPSTSRHSRVSWRPTTGDDKANNKNSKGHSPLDRAEGKKAVFIAAAPSGRTFDEIAQQAKQRRQAAQMAASFERDMRRRQEDLDRRIQHYYSYSDADISPCHADPAAEGAMERYRERDDDEGGHDDEVAAVDDGRRGSLRPTSASGESIYNVLDGDSGGRRTVSSHQYGRQRPHAPSPRHCDSDGDDDNSEEPDVEVIEMAVDDDEYLTSAAKTEHRPLAQKDPELERVLREEEPFSRPATHRTYHETCAARDLIYSQPYEAPERASSAAGPSPMHRLSRKTEDWTAATNTNTAQSSTQYEQQQQQQHQHQQNEEVFRFGRKRFDGNNYDDDHVGSLLKYRT